MKRLSNEILTPNSPRKRRTVKQLHRMWLASIERVTKLTAHTWDILQEVYDTVEPNENGLRVVYADDYRGQLRYEVYRKKGSEYISFTRRYREDETKSRVAFVDAILNQYLDERLVDLGDRLNLSERTSDTSVQKVVFGYFWLELTKYLKKEYDKTPIDFHAYDEESIMSITIHKKKYYIGVVRYYKGYNFTWYGEKIKDIIL